MYRRAAHRPAPLARPEPARAVGPSRYRGPVTTAQSTVVDGADLARYLWGNVASMGLMTQPGARSPRWREAITGENGALQVEALYDLYPPGQRHRLDLHPDSERGWRGMNPLLTVHGHTWAGSHLPARYSRGMMKACYQNSWAKVARSKRLVYCEGMAMSAHLGVPMAHAWVYDPDDGTVIETTWETSPNDPFQHAYLGLALPADLVREARARSRRFQIISVMDGDWARDGWFHREGWQTAVEYTRETVGPIT